MGLGARGGGITKRKMSTEEQEQAMAFLEFYERVQDLTGTDHILFKSHETQT